MLLDFQRLTRVDDKTAGKNRSHIDGFYRDDDENEYFIKAPNDKKELFTELFAGLLLSKFKEKGLIESQESDSLICANYISIPNEGYALIQPRVQFKELFKIIKTGNWTNTDKMAWLEVLDGPRRYDKLGSDHQGLDTALMYSLLLGAHSVHSANIVRLQSNEKQPTPRFARIDFGDALRHICKPNNNHNVLWPAEYQGYFNYRGITKGYFQNYKHVPNCLSHIAAQAKGFEQRLSDCDQSLAEMIADVLRSMPEDLIDKSTQADLAVYLGEPLFDSVTLGSKGNSRAFSESLADVLAARLTQITQLQSYEGSEMWSLTKRCSHIFKLLGAFAFVALVTMVGLSLTSVVTGTLPIIGVLMMTVVTAAVGYGITAALIKTQQTSDFYAPISKGHSQDITMIDRRDACAESRSGTPQNKQRFLLHPNATRLERNSCFGHG